MLHVLALENEGPKSRVRRVERRVRDPSFAEAFAEAFAAEGGETSVAVAMMLDSFLDAVVGW